MKPTKDEILIRTTLAIHYVRRSKQNMSAARAACAMLVVLDAHCIRNGWWV